jgi:hypothetical protein
MHAVYNCSVDLLIGRLHRDRRVLRTEWVYEICSGEQLMVKLDMRELVLQKQRKVIVNNALVQSTWRATELKIILLPDKVLVE